MGRWTLLVLLFLAMTGCTMAEGRSEVTGQATDWTLVLVKRMDTMERLMLDQSREMTTLRQLVKTQSRELTNQNQELLLQSEQLANQQRQLRHQHDVMSNLEGVVRAQSEELLDLRTTLRVREATHIKGSRSSWTPLLKDTVGPSKPVGESDDKKKPGSAVQQVESQAQSSQTIAGHCTCNKLSEKPTTGRQNTAEKSQSVENSETDHEELDADGTPEVRAIAGTSKRSDDGGPLEVVVSQLSQKVTEMSADIQSFKAQTASDIQSLKTHTDASIQSLTTQTSTDIQSLKTHTDASIQTLTTQTSADIQSLTSSNQLQDQNIQDARTSTFVRWGNSHCGSESQLVYSGVLGGSLWSETGAATNYLCLTMSPVFSPSITAYAHLYGGEYEVGNVANQDPVCAVCRSTFSTTIMIPGTNVCTPGWHTQYNGFLMAGNALDAAGSEFICVDSALESSVHSEQDQNGKLLHYTKTVCGSLPCGPYANDKTVTCAVCSK